MSAFSLAGYYTLAMILDCDLLRRYAETRSEDAFAELVRRHINLVYSAAMRQVNGDSHLAQDVAQTVFTELARKAAALSGRHLLTGWLYTCTHFIVSDDEAILTVYAFGIGHTAKFKFQRDGSDWKFAGPIKGDPTAAAK